MLSTVLSASLRSNAEVYEEWLFKKIEIVQDKLSLDSGPTTSLNSNSPHYWNSNDSESAFADTVPFQDLSLTSQWIMTILNYLDNTKIAFTGHVSSGRHAGTCLWYQY